MKIDHEVDKSTTFTVPDVNKETKTEAQTEMKTEFDVVEGEERGVEMSNAAQDLESILRSYENDLNCK